MMIITQRNNIIGKLMNTKITDSQSESTNFKEMEYLKRQRLIMINRTILCVGVNINTVICIVIFIVIVLVVNRL